MKKLWVFWFLVKFQLLIPPEEKLCWEIPISEISHWCNVSLYLVQASKGKTQLTYDLEKTTDTES